MNEILTFQNTSPSLESYWRSIILFGRNVASYKFALAKSLLEIIPSGQSEISLEALAEPFSRNLCEHLKTAPKQATSQSSQFLDACRAFNDGRLSIEELLDVTRKKGFNNVIDAFHVVNDDPIPIQFYSKDYSGSCKKNHPDRRSIQAHGIAIIQRFFLRSRIPVESGGNRLGARRFKKSPECPIRR